MAIEVTAIEAELSSTIYSLNATLSDEAKQITGVSSIEALEQYNSVRYLNSVEERRLKDQFNYWIKIGIDLLSKNHFEQQHKI